MQAYGVECVAVSTHSLTQKGRGPDKWTESHLGKKNPYGALSVHFTNLKVLSELKTNVVHWRCLAIIFLAVGRVRQGGLFFLSEFDLRGKFAVVKLDLASTNQKHE